MHIGRAVLSCFVLILALTLVNSAYAEVDLQSITVEDVIMTKHEYQENDTVSFSIKISDDSMIYSVFAWMYTPSSEYRPSWYGKYNPTTGYYDINQKITETCPEGEWDVDAIYIYTGTGPSRRICNSKSPKEYPNDTLMDLSALDFAVTDSRQAEIEVQDVWLNSNQFSFGDTIKVNVRLNTPDIDVTYITAEFNCEGASPMPTVSTSQTAFYDATNNCYSVCTALSSALYGSGEWHMTYITISDDSYGLRYFSNTDYTEYENVNRADLSKCIFTIAEYQEPSSLEVYKNNFLAQSELYFNGSTDILHFDMSNVSYDLSAYAKEVYGECQDVEYMGTTLVIEGDSVAFRNVFYLPNGKEDNLTFSHKLTEKGNGYWYTEFPMTDPRRFGQQYSIHVQNSTTGEMLTVAVSPLSYAYSALSEPSTTTELRNVVLAMYQYYSIACS